MLKAKLKTGPRKIEVKAEPAEGKGTTGAMRDASTGRYRRLPTASTIEMFRRSMPSSMSDDGMMQPEEAETLTRIGDAQNMGLDSRHWSEFGTIFAPMT